MNAGVLSYFEYYVLPINYRAMDLQVYKKCDKIITYIVAGRLDYWFEDVLYVYFQL